MEDEFLILKVARASIRKQGIRYYTFDHRRLWCMYQAGCAAMRVRVVMFGRSCRAFAGAERNLSNPKELDRDPGVS